MIAAAKQAARDALRRVLRDAVREEIEAHARELCAAVGHDERIVRWLGYGETRICQRCGSRRGLKAFERDAGGRPAPIYYGGEGEA